MHIQKFNLTIKDKKEIQKKSFKFQNLTKRKIKTPVLFSIFIKVIDF